MITDKNMNRKQVFYDYFGNSLETVLDKWPYKITRMCSVKVDLCK